MNVDKGHSSCTSYYESCTLAILKARQVRVLMRSSSLLASLRVRPVIPQIFAQSTKFRDLSVIICSQPIIEGIGSSLASPAQAAAPNLALQQPSPKLGICMIQIGLHRVDTTSLLLAKPYPIKTCLCFSWLWTGPNLSHLSWVTSLASARSCASANTSPLLEDPWVKPHLDEKNEGVRVKDARN